jgi:hypothetical protein
VLHHAKTPEDEELAAASLRRLMNSKLSQRKKITMIRLALVMTMTLFAGAASAQTLVSPELRGSPGFDYDGPQMTTGWPEPPTPTFQTYRYGGQTTQCTTIYAGNSSWTDCR